MNHQMAKLMVTVETIEMRSASKLSLNDSQYDNPGNPFELLRPW